MKTSMSSRAAILSALLLVLLLGVWEALCRTPAATASAAADEYALLMGAAEQEARVPPPSVVLAHAYAELSEPFYDRGPNDKGIGIQLAHSLYRVLTGYLLAALVAIPVGFVIGMSPLMYRALNPFIQILRPISPLAWVNVARTHELSPLRTAYSVILPAALPTILTGMRISVGIAWLVIVAAEMLVGGTGIGYYVWNEWNNLDLASVIFSILMIGLVGMLLDLLLGSVARLVSYQE